jgi:hypothetical protein
MVAEMFPKDLSRARSPSAVLSPWSRCRNERVDAASTTENPVFSAILRIARHAGMPTQRDDDDDAFDLPGRPVRMDLTLTQADYAQLRDLAAKADLTMVAVTSMALSLGLSVLVGPVGADVLDGLAMTRFLRGRK